MTEEKLQSFRAVLGSTNPFGFESQLWRINNEGRLENLQGEWKYSNSTWSIPNEGKDGYITDLELGKVLEIESRGLEINVNLTILPRNTNQIWKRGQQDVDGWFTLKNSRRSLFLSRKSNFSLTGYSLSEALILASINPKYGDRLFIELQVKYKKTISSRHVGRGEARGAYTPSPDFWTPRYNSPSTCWLHKKIVVIFTFRAI